MSNHDTRHSPEHSETAEDNLSVSSTWQEVTTPSEAQDNRSLFNQLLFLVVGAMVALSWASPLSFSLNFFQGVLICILSAVPLLRWALKQPYPYPFFEIYTAMSGPAYGVPLLWENQNLSVFDSESVTRSAWAVLLFLAVSLLTFYSMRPLPRSTPFWTKPIFKRPPPNLLLAASYVSVGYMVVNQYFYYFPPMLQGPLRAVFFGLFMASVFMLTIMWGQRALTQQQSVQLVGLLAINFIVLSASLVLRSGASVILLGMVGYFLGCRAVPWKALIVFFAIFSILNLGKYHMRGNYWFGNEQPQPTLSELPGFYSEWIKAGISMEGSDDSSGGKLLIERSSLLQMLCLVVQKSPEHAPFLEGETYVQTLGQFVPRFLWPEKPRGHISTYTLAIHYGLQNEEATSTTTIAFGFLSEAFANFGMFGIAGIAAAMAAAYRLLATRTSHTPILSYGGIVVIMVTAWSFQTEQALSIWLTSMFQGLVATLAAVWLAQRLVR